jgi:hypothetical protein
VVEHADPHHAAAEHRHAHMRFHGNSPLGLPDRSADSANRVAAGQRAK